MIFRYVLHEHVADYLRLGWMLCPPLGPPHEYYSALLCWMCACKCVEPTNEHRRSRSSLTRMEIRKKMQRAEARRALACTYGGLFSKLGHVANLAFCSAAMQFSMKFCVRCPHSSASALRFCLKSARQELSISSIF